MGNALGNAYGNSRARRHWRSFAGSLSPPVLQDPRWMMLIQQVVENGTVP